VERRTTLFQTVVTAVVSNSEWIEGLEIVAQDPNDLKAEEASLRATAQASYEQMGEAQQRLLELSKRYFAEGKPCDEVLGVLMPA
jgi:hypothetical protein